MKSLMIFSAIILTETRLLNAFGAAGLDKVADTKRIVHQKEDAGDDIFYQGLGTEADGQSQKNVTDPVQDGRDPVGNMTWRILPRKQIF
jgi:hypothetical protein